MRATRILADEQYRLIMEFCTRGLTDPEWCLQHDIKSGTFYNWVKRLRKSGCLEIPNATSHHHSPRRMADDTMELSIPGTVMTNDELSKLVPWNETVQEICTGMI